MVSKAFQNSQNQAAMGFDPKAYIDVKNQRIVAEHHSVNGENVAGTNAHSVWTTRPITRSSNSIPGASVDTVANTVTLPAGMTFRISGYQSFYRTGISSVAVVAASGTSYRKIGDTGNAYSAGSVGQSVRHGVSMLTTDQETTLVMQYLTSVSQTNNGLGASSTGASEDTVHAQLVIERVA